MWFLFERKVEKNNPTEICSVRTFARFKLHKSCVFIVHFTSYIEWYVPCMQYDKLISNWQTCVQFWFQTQKHATFIQFRPRWFPEIAACVCMCVCDARQCHYICALKRNHNQYRIACIFAESHELNIKHLLQVCVCLNVLTVHHYELCFTWRRSFVKFVRVHNFCECIFYDFQMQFNVKFKRECTQLSAVLIQPV